MSQAGAKARVDDGRRLGVAILNPLVREIAETLLELGGAAHRDLVIAHIAKKRGIYRPPASLAQELDNAFSTYCGGASDPRSSGLLHLPYGPHTRRWALTDQAYGLLHDGQGPEFQISETR
jgi:hypothetical protein